MLISYLTSDVYFLSLNDLFSDLSFPKLVGTNNFVLSFPLKGMINLFGDSESISDVNFVPNTQFCVKNFNLHQLCQVNNTIIFDHMIIALHLAR